MRVLIDPDPAFPRVRIVRDDEGPFLLAPAPGRSSPEGRVRPHLVRVGLHPQIPDKELSRYACLWVPVDDLPGAIDIELPREMRRASVPTPSAVKPKERV